MRKMILFYFAQGNVEIRTFEARKISNSMHYQRIAFTLLFYYAVIWLCYCRLDVYMIFVPSMYSYL